MSRCIDRIQAQQDGRALTVAAHCQSDEAYRHLSERLVIETGPIAKSVEGPAGYDDTRDTAGFEELRALGRARIGDMA